MYAVKNSVKTKSKVRVFLDKKYKVIFHNDDKTTYEFVIYCLMNIFNHDIQTAIDLTVQVDKNGFCVAGKNYTRDIAESKKNEVISLAAQNGFPFVVSIEED